MSAPDPDALQNPLAQLEAEIAAAEARGEPLPAQAYEMLARLRELMGALRSLTESFETGGEPGAAAPPDEPRPGTD